MIADYMTKPLQGALFKKFRDLIMGVRPVSIQDASENQPTKKNLAPTKSKARRHRSVLDSNDGSKGTKKNQNHKPQKKMSSTYKHERE